MARRIVLGVVAVLLIAAIVVVIVVRQVVFGGTPTIHRRGTQPTVAISPCATFSAASGVRAFKIITAQSDASYEAHFLAAGQSVPGTVTGITGDVSGMVLLTLDQQPTITSLRIVVDLRSLDSGAPERDAHVRDDTLETNKYPYAIFTATNARVLSASYPEGQTVPFRLQGQLTLHGVTRPATFEMRGQVSGQTLTGSATSLIHLQDFQMVAPMTTSVVPITVSKDITLTVHFTGQRALCTSLI